MASILFEDSEDEPFKSRLIWTALFWCVIALVSLALSYYVWGVCLKVDNAPTLALTTTGGLGVITATIFNWEKQRLAAYESKQSFLKKRADDLVRDNKQLADYAEMLSTCIPAKVSAALLGIGALADLRAQHDSENVSEFNQRCVGIICSFIRNEGENSEESRKNAQVNQREALRVIRNHCLDKSVNSWSTCEFDLSDTHFWTKIDLDYCVFKSAVNFAKASFGKNFYARNTEFSNVIFDDVQFDGEVDCSYATFGEVSFCGHITFQKDVMFYSTDFQNQVFFGAFSKNDDGSFLDYPSRKLITFKENVTFLRTKFGAVHFAFCDFVGAAFFRGIVVESTFTLENSVFSKSVDFDEAIFSGRCRFSGVDAKNLYFTKVVFREKDTESQCECRFTTVKVTDKLCVDGTDFPKDLIVRGDCQYKEISPPDGSGAIYDGFSISQVEQ